MSKKESSGEYCPFYGLDMTCQIKTGVRNAIQRLNGGGSIKLLEALEIIADPSQSMPSLAEPTRRRDNNNEPILMCRASRSGRGTFQDVVKAQQKCDFLDIAKEVDKL